MIGDVTRALGLGEEDSKTVTKEIGTLFVTKKYDSNLSTNSEFNCRNPFGIRERLSAPAVSVLTLAIGSQTDEILIDHRISSAFPIFDITMT